LVARPVFRSEDLLNRAVKHGQTIKGVLRDLVGSASSSQVFPRGYVPDFAAPGTGGWTQRTEGYIGLLEKPGRKDDRQAPRYTLNLQIDFDGSGHLFCGGAGERQHDGEPCLIFSSVIAGNTTRFLTLLGGLYKLTRYIGGVDIGVALTGLKG